MIPASPNAIFAVLSDPDGHVTIDSSGMLQGACGDLVTAVGDAFVVHMDHESIGDLPTGTYDVRVLITDVTVSAPSSGRSREPLSRPSATYTATSSKRSKRNLRE